MNTLQLPRASRNGAPAHAADALPPHDEAEEQAVLGSMLMDPTLCAAAFDSLHPEDFFLERHRAIFLALKAMRASGEAIDTLTVYQRLKSQPDLGDDLLAYLGDLPDKHVISIANLVVHVDTVRALSVQRLCRIGAQEIAQQLDANPHAAPVIAARAAEMFADLHNRMRPKGGRTKLTLRSPDELLGMSFDDRDNILGDRLLALFQQLVIVAAGGLGKSRLLLQLIAAIVSGRRFLEMETGAPHLRWLILQTENSNRRLQFDLARVKAWLGSEDWQRFCQRVIIHTVEHDGDGFVSLDSPENQEAIAAAIAEAKPDAIAVDPLNDFAVGDINKDTDMKATVQALARVCRRGNPARPIVVLHHALTGKGGAMKATGYDRSSFSRNSKALFAWTRGQINIAPASADNNDRLIVACGKCSNGREFPAFGIKLDPETFIYEPDPSIDVGAWEKEMAGASDRGPLIDNEGVAALCKGLSTKAELAKAIMDEAGCYRGSAYRYIARATGKTIKHNKSNDTYSRK